MGHIENMRRALLHNLCFAITFGIGVTIAICLIFLRSNGGDIAALTLVDDAPSSAPIAGPESMPDSPIQRIDFANFRYPSYVVEGEVHGFKLRDGELLPKRKDEVGRPLDMWLRLSGVTYGDVTGDGVEEAIVDVTWITGGTGDPDLVYIYALRKGKLKLLWAFATGDRADGGYKNVFAENGQLFVELFGKDKIIGTNLYKEDGTHTGACCPTFVTRTRYAWANNRFRAQGESEILPLTRQ